MTEGEVGKLKELLLLALSAKAYREAERAASLGDVQAASPGEGATPAVNGPLRDVLQLQLIPSDELKAPELKRGEVNLGDGLKSALLDLGFNDLDEESLPLVLERLLALVGEGAGRTEEGQLTKSAGANVELCGRIIYCYLRHNQNEKFLFVGAAQSRRDGKFAIQFARPGSGYEQSVLYCEVFGSSKRSLIYADWLERRVMGALPRANDGTVALGDEKEVFVRLHGSERGLSVCAKAFGDGKDLRDEIGKLATETQLADSALARHFVHACRLLRLFDTIGGSSPFANKDKPTKKELGSQDLISRWEVLFALLVHGSLLSVDASRFYDMQASARLLDGDSLVSSEELEFEGRRLLTRLIEENSRWNDARRTRAHGDTPESLQPSSTERAEATRGGEGGAVASESAQAINAELLTILVDEALRTVPDGVLISGRQEEEMRIKVGGFLTDLLANQETILVDSARFTLQALLWNAESTPSQEGRVPGASVLARALASFFDRDLTNQLEMWDAWWQVRPRPDIGKILNDSSTARHLEDALAIMDGVRRKLGLSPEAHARHSKAEHAVDLESLAEGPRPLGPRASAAIEFLSSFFCRYYQATLPNEAFTAEIERRRPDGPNGLAAAERRLADLVGRTHMAAQVETLLGAGLTSAAAIAGVGEGAFVGRFGERPEFGTDVARTVYRKAWRKHLTAQTLAANFYSDRWAAELPVLGGRPGALMAGEKSESRLAQVKRKYPDLEYLFDLADICECDWERSIWSPGAYLVDVLEFLKTRGTRNCRSAKDVLLCRRPDLAETELSPENTSTELPYVDLVCELLEERVAPSVELIPHKHVDSPGFSKAVARAFRLPPQESSPVEVGQPGDAKRLFRYLRLGTHVFKCTPVRSADDDKCPDAGADRGWMVKRLRQTTRPADQLQACPEYLNLGAYEALRGANPEASLKLPFDLDHAEASAYLEQLEVPRAALMEALGLGDKLVRAGERLGLSSGERRAITQEQPGLAALWNLSLQDLANVKKFLTASGLSHQQLVELLALPFIHQGNAIAIERPSESDCDTSQMTIRGLDGPALDRIHRFLRLLGRLDWTMDVVDRALMAARLGNAALNQVTLKRLGWFVKLPKMTGLSPGELAIFFGEIPHVRSTVLWKQAEPTIYDRMFFDVRFRRYIDSRVEPKAVELNAQQSNNAATLLDVADALCAGFAIPRDAIESLVDTFCEGSTLSHPNLARLYSAKLFAKSLALPLEELAALRLATAIDPFKSPCDTVHFIEAARLVADAGLKPTALLYLLQNRSSRLGELEFSFDAVVNLLSELGDAYEKSKHEGFTPTDPLNANWLRFASLLDELPKLPSLKGDATPELAFDKPEDRATLETIVRGSYFSPDCKDAPAAKLEIERGEKVASASKFLDEHLEAYDRWLALPASGWTDLLLAIATAGIEKPPSEELLQILLDGAVAALTDIAHRNALVELVAKFTKCDPKVATPLLDALQVPGQSKVIGDVLIPDGKPSDATDPRVVAMRVFYKVTQFILQLSVSSAELDWLLERPTQIGLPELATVPVTDSAPPWTWEAWRRMWRALAYNRRFPPVLMPATVGVDGRSDSFLDVLTSAAPKEDGSLTVADLPEIRGRLQSLTGWPTGAMQAVEELHGGPKYFDPTWLISLEIALSTLNRLGLPAGKAGAIALKDELDRNDVETLAQALRARYAPESWLAALKKIQDQLRSQKRDALAAILVDDRQAYPDRQAIRDDLLIEVDMAPCMRTSRIVQAHGAAQSFVMRCLMGMEPEVSVPAGVDDADRIASGWGQWKWMKNYRVWEANRKVFLYPENWIEPELRRDRSIFFEELESDIDQNELSIKNLERSSQSFLEKVFDVALLEVRAVYYDAEERTLHVVARTRGGSPTRYFHRTWDSTRTWTPWARIELEITGDHLACFKHNRRLRLAWLTITREAERKKLLTSDYPTANNPPPAARVRNRLQLSLSEFDGSTWLPPRMSQRALYDPSEGDDVGGPQPRYSDEENLPDPSTIRMVFESAPSAAIILSRSDRDGEGVLGQFSLEGCKGYPEPARPSTKAKPIYLPDFDRTHREYCRFEADTRATALVVLNGPGMLSRRPLFGRAQGVFRLASALHSTEIDLALSLELRLTEPSNPGFFTSLGAFVPFFYEDGGGRVYSLTPLLERTGNDDEPVDIHGLSDVFLGQAATGGMVGLSSVMRELGELWTSTTAEEWHDRLVTLTKRTGVPQTIAAVRSLRHSREVFRPDAFYHPYVCDFIRHLQRGGFDELFRRSTQFPRRIADFYDRYLPNPLTIRVEPEDENHSADGYPVSDLDFSRRGSYSSYNWELFFHLPFSIAVRLSREQRFEDAERWFRFVFNPIGALESDPGASATAAVPSSPAPQSRYWITRPFYLHAQTDYLIQRIDTLLELIHQGSQGPVNVPPGHVPLKRFVEEQLESVEQWRKHPFEPHRIASYRWVAYQKAIVMKYLDNLIAWGDQLFRQFTQESVNEALLNYRRAEALLGPRPQTIRRTTRAKSRAYEELRLVDRFDNAELTNPDSKGSLELVLEEALSSLQIEYSDEEVGPGTPFHTPLSLYFCIPFNEKLFTYWDTVQDRVQKILHCLDIDGVPRSLSLFAPPIDPALLVRATAAGLDISDILNGLGEPLPFYRFSVYERKALELAQEVRALGGTLLSAMEKRDAEALGRLRADQEIRLLEISRDAKKLQIEEARRQIQSLDESITSAERRLDWYKSREEINDQERLSMDLTNVALVTRGVGQALQAASGAAHMLPNFEFGGSGFGGSPVGTLSIGGTNIGSALSAQSAVVQFLADVFQTQGGIAATRAGFQRRKEDWELQATLAEREIAQLAKQKEAAEIRLEIYEADLRTHEKQATQAKDTSDYLRSKFTGTELYGWMAAQIMAVYYQAYQAAFVCAKKAEKCFTHEIGEAPRTSVGVAAWDAGRKGLLAGDRLVQDIQRLGAEYLEKNRLDIEITQSISLRTLSPEALLLLRATGKCSFELPEELFDTYYPGHYRRRLKTVSLTIPCVLGPYTPLACKVSQTQARYRKDSGSSGIGYPAPDDGAGFEVWPGAVQSFVTSTGLRDGGRFDLNLRDERYLPFEGCGVIGTWSLELPEMDVRAFDYDTIEDAILHVQYTARDGGDSARKAASNNVKAQLGAKDASRGYVSSLRHDEPELWLRIAEAGQTVRLRSERLPYPFGLTAAKAKLSIQRVTWYATGAAPTLEFGGQQLLFNAVDRSSSYWSCVVDKLALSFDADIPLRLLTGSPNDLLCVVDWNMA